MLKNNFIGELSAETERNFSGITSELIGNLSKFEFGSMNTREKSLLQLLDPQPTAVALHSKMPTNQGIISILMIVLGHEGRTS
jgi:hypothetical protein